MEYRQKTAGAVPITHEALKKLLGINETADITGIVYRPVDDIFVICVRPTEGRTFTFGGQEFPAYVTAEGTDLCYVTPIVGQWAVPAVSTPKVEA